MKLLLTSNGFVNHSISKALLDLVGKPFSELKLAFIPTAANVVKEDKGWLINDLINCRNLGFAFIDIVDISAVPRDIWEPRLNNADILLFGGGNTHHLMYWIKKSGLKEILPEMLTNKVYVGISAGSIITGPTLSVSTSIRLYSLEIGEHKDEKALGFVNFHIRPHLNAPKFPKIRKELLAEMASELKEPMYAIDDQTAIKIVGTNVEIVSEGEYLIFNPSNRF